MRRTKVSHKKALKHTQLTLKIKPKLFYLKNDGSNQPLLRQQQDLRGGRKIPPGFILPTCLRQICKEFQPTSFQLEISELCP